MSQLVATDLEAVSEAPAQAFAAPSWAAVSFVFEDAFWCDWLFREFDGLRVPRALINRPSRDGLPYPDRLSVSPDPTDSAQLENYDDALKTAQHLIVVVSPSSGKSELLARHMKLFRAAGGEERVVALVVNGEPGSPTAVAATLGDRGWMPKWLEWRLTENGFAAAERTEPIVVDARMGVATLAEVRAKLLAAMLEVPVEKLRDLGIVPRPVSRGGTPDAGVAASGGTVVVNAPRRESRGFGWPTAIALTAIVAVGALFMWKTLMDDTDRTAAMTSIGLTNDQDREPASAPAVEVKVGGPVVVAVPVDPSAKKNAEQTSEQPLKSVVAKVPDNAAREIAAAVSRRDRLFFLAEARTNAGEAEEAFGIYQQAAQVAEDLLRKSGSAAEHTLRAAEIHRRVGQLAPQYGSSAEAKKGFERARQLILQLRASGAGMGDAGAKILLDAEAGLKKLAGV